MQELGRLYREEKNYNQVKVKKVKITNMEYVEERRNVSSLCRAGNKIVGFVDWPGTVSALRRVVDASVCTYNYMVC